METVSPEGFRHDGRLPTDTRPTTIEPLPPRSSSANILRGPLVGNRPSKALVYHGSTYVLAEAYGPTDLKLTDTSNITVTVLFAPFAEPARRIRKRSDHLSVAIGHHLQQLFSSVILLNEKLHVHLCITILHCDGSVLATAINAATVALVRAGIQMKDTIVAISGGIKNENILVDLDEMEESADGFQFTVAVCGHTKKIALLSSDGRSSPEELLKVVDTAIEGNLDKINVTVCSALRNDAIQNVPAL